MVNLPIYNSSPCLIIRYNNEVWLLNMFCASAQNIYEKKKKKLATVLLLFPPTKSFPQCHKGLSVLFPFCHSPKHEPHP